MPWPKRQASIEGVREPFWGATGETTFSAFLAQQPQGAAIDCCHTTGVQGLTDEAASGLAWCARNLRSTCPRIGRSLVLPTLSGAAGEWYAGLRSSDGCRRIRRQVNNDRF